MKFHDILLTTVIAALVGVAACSSSDDHDHGSSGGVHSSPYPACDAILKACHLYDFGPGPLHDCHDIGHGAKSDSDCAPRKDACLKICDDAAKAEDAGTSAEAGQATDAARD